VLRGVGSSPVRGGNGAEIRCGRSSGAFYRPGPVPPPMVSPTRRRPDEERRRREPPALILAGRAFVLGKLQPVEIAISEDGWIQSVGKVVKGPRRHDVGDAVILPAATDLHVHFRDPGGDSRVENFTTGTIQAALGGVALVGEIPNTTPPVTNLESLQDKEARVRRHAAVDVLLYATPSDPRALSALATHAGAFKVYLSPTTGVPDPPETRALPDLLARLARLGLPVSFHAEDAPHFSGTSPPTDPASWNAHRPPASERAALDHILPGPTSLQLHVAHVTTPEAAERLRIAGVSFEVTPQHLLLNDRTSRDALTKVNPPLRSESDRRDLWVAFTRGEVPILASDHAPHSLEEKERPFPLAPSGMPGVETMLPLLLAKVRATEVPLPVLVGAACDRPARLLGQPHGRIAPGHRAHLMVVDFTKRTRVRATHLHAPCGWTAFEGWEAIFPREVYVRGQRVVHGGEYEGKPTGQVVRPEFAPRPPASK